MKELTEAEVLIKDWNGGMLNGAKTKLSKEIDVSPSNISDWLHNRQRPSERAVKKMAKLFNKTEDEVYKAFVGDKPKNITQNNIKSKDCNINLYKNEIINERLKNIDLKLDLILQIIKKE